MPGAEGVLGEAAQLAAATAASAGKTATVTTSEAAIVEQCKAESAKYEVMAAKKSEKDQKPDSALKDARDSRDAVCKKAEVFLTKMGVGNPSALSPL